MTEAGSGGCPRQPKRCRYDEIRSLGPYQPAQFIALEHLRASWPETLWRIVFETPRSISIGLRE